MRILHFVPSLDLDTGGPARSVPDLCRALSDRGVDQRLFSFRRPGATVAVGENEPFQIQWFRPWRTSREFPTLKFYQELMASLEQFDLVHIHSLWNLSVGLASLACRRAGVPYMISPRGMLQKGALRRKRMLKAAYYNLWEHRTIGGASFIHFFTEAEAVESADLVPTNGPQSVIIPSGVDPALGQQINQGSFREAYPLLKDRRIVLFVGRLHWSKGLDIQMKALKILSDEFPDLIWVFVGPDSGEWGKVKRLIRDNGLDRQTLWTGLLSREECLEALLDADIFVLTSRHEAHSMAMNEALAMGVPIVITDTVQFNDLEKYGAGLICPREPEHIANAVKHLLSQPIEARKLSEAGRRLVGERLAWPRVAEAMAKVYTDIFNTSHIQSKSGDY